ncbi:SDR family NAD(P)-dependent oxidoreductase [Cellvibrio sp. QJXJ]|uniref:SDR family NAD(P)-dependent oxidoreductase n=1 Tax=Cellvibrio sp. QJXJ TaxID=2964606 RepID=UPI0021C444CA|nr:SDR family NAD(P)-dependent oxidoreductase [Cellvibrio sp. QJXJ]UUA73397.1 SDR family NAD(P)-dependent oxidoreductase [Cellvibrio sp. QJXJ]
MSEKMLSAKKTKEILSTASQALRKAKEKLEKIENQRNEPIAVIGMSGRFPGGGTQDDFWQLLKEGRSAISEIPEFRWNAEQGFDSTGTQENVSYSKWGGFIEGVDEFDPLFFNLSPAEAATMDPQQRIFLQEAWHTFEDAGYQPADLAGSKCGVYVGVMNKDYQVLLEQDSSRERKASELTGSSSSILAARISYLLDLKGPNMAVDTACSSSLVAIYLACCSIRSQECDMALAGGVTLHLDQSRYILMSQSGMLSPEGKCKAFDNRADGFVPGEGVGAILLKSLSQAEKDGDSIYAVIKGFGVNQDGASNGITAPNALSQVQLINDVYKQAKVDPATIGFVEAHGTGTPLGDPIEVEALSTAFRGSTDKKQYCAIGSVKSNIGHAIAAAGVASMTKILLAFKNNTIPPSVHFNQANEKIDFLNSPFYVNTESQPWVAVPGEPRRAAISSFGFSGTNCHLLLEEYQSIDEPAHNLDTTEKNYYTVVVSARDEERLTQYVQRLSGYLKDADDVSLKNFAYTLQVGRKPMPQRAAFVARDKDALIREFDAFIKGENKSELCFVGSAKNQTKNKLTEQEKSILTVVKPWKDIEIVKTQAMLWAAGAKVDWKKLYVDEQVQPKRMSLPTYPFAQQTFWLGDVKKNDLALSVQDHSTVLRPLLHRNTSTLLQQRYSTLLQSEKFYLADHQLHDDLVLPGVCHLEMARTALFHASEALSDQGVVEIKNITWLQPIIVGKENVRLHIALLPEGEDIAYTVYSEEGSNRYFHSEGVMSLLPDVDAPVIDLSALKSELLVNELSVSDCYAQFASVGLNYGPAFKGIDQCYLGDGQLLAHLAMPQSVASDSTAYGLHPSILDAALQASVVLIWQDGCPPEDKMVPSIPFSLDKITIYENCNTSLWVVVRYSQGSNVTSSVRRFDIDLCDENGEVHARLEGFSTRRVSADKSLLERKVGGKTIYSREGEELNPTASKFSALELNDSTAKATLSDFSIQYLKRVLSRYAELPVEQIKAEAELEEYGIDSVMAIGMTKELEKDFGRLSKTLFFEYRTLEELSGYFLEEFSGSLANIIGFNANINDSKKNTAAAEPLYQSTTDELVAEKLPSARFITQRHIGPGQTVDHRLTDDIAIVGVSGRYPQADDLITFWRNIKNGVDCISEVPKNRWDAEQYYAPEKGTPGKIYTKWGGFLDGVENFDAGFFNISPLEAKGMDPQERLFLECAYSTIEDAGYTKDVLNGQGKVGVFVGIWMSEYQLHSKTDMTAGYGHGVLSSLASVPNRVSFAMGFSGPSIAVDTMCSSSLTALHLACQSIRQGECKAAIVGGVNVNIHPNKYHILAQGRFASTDGYCKSFGEGGDGYVPAEGVGALLVKPLSEAKKAKDHIYGIVKSTALNHGGKTNGYNVPNPIAQADVIRQALKDAKINPRTLSYVEAHGTGTALGDPIEINGLNRVFKEYTNDKQFCAIGSVKSNIGHCESAAGLAGISKILLQMKHQMLVPSLHSHQLNKNIDFSDSPFSVQQAATKWSRPVIEEQGKKKEYPLRASVSSFGAGGSNSCAIIEEAPTLDHGQNAAINEADLPVAIVLSARNQEQLQIRAQRLLSDLNNLEVQDGELNSHLVSIAYTLQVGREAMRARLGLIVHSMSELKNRIQQFLNGEKSAEGVFLGQKQDVHKAERDEDYEQLVNSWLSKRKYSRLLDIWVSGYNVDWEKCYPQQAIARVSLSSYPFVRERYWISDEWAKDAKSSGVKQEQNLHPLVHQNSSTLFSEQRYSTRLSADDFYLSDHKIQGESVLPGVAYIEMAREALLRATESKSSDICVEIRNILWRHRAVVRDEPLDIHIGLFPEENQEVNLLVYSEAGDEKTVFSQCLAKLLPATTAPMIDLDEIRSGVSDSPLSAAQIYKHFHAIGHNFGPAFQGLNALYTRDDEVLARLKLPEPAQSTLNDFVLHPTMLESALHSTVLMFWDLENPLNSEREPSIPLSMDRVTVYGGCCEVMWVWARYAPGTTAESKIKKFDLALCDEDGNMCVRIEGFAVRQIKVDDKQQTPTLHFESAQSESRNNSPVKKNVVTKDFSSLSLVEQGCAFLKQMVSETIEMPVENMESKAQLTEYGINSVMTLDMTKKLEADFGSLSTTLFFEFQTIEELAEFFAEHHTATLQKVTVRMCASDAQMHSTNTQSENALASIEKNSQGSDFEKFIVPRVKLRSIPMANRREQDIAIIGLSGRYPQADNMNAYWQNFVAGKDCITDIPRERWNSESFFDERKGVAGKNYCKWGGFIQGVADFDPRFFSISPVEAEYLDPQERIFLQCAYSTLEDAGYTKDSICASRSVGVFVGAWMSEYQLYGKTDMSQGESYGLHGSTGTIANRVSYTLGFRGPSIATDTMCSSSLTSLHLACQSLRQGECSAAIVGGVNILIHPNKYHVLAQEQFLASNGRCISFGEGGDGYVPGEGVGAVLLKPLHKAISDNDHIYGVIKGSAVNHGGKANGFTVPHPQAQAAVISRALSDADVDPRTLSYVEAHGTGTPLGDPIEIAGLTRAFGQYTKDTQYCAIGSVKSNIGHCESAAGIAGVSKVLLQMKHRKLVPSLHSEQLNRNIDFSRTPFVVQQSLADWPRPVIEHGVERKEYPRRATVSSFGAGGSNACVVLEEYVAPARETVSSRDLLNSVAIVLSARTEAALKQRVERLLADVQELVANQESGNDTLVRIAYTLQTGREAMRERLGFVVNSVVQLQEKLTHYLQGHTLDNLYQGKVVRGDGPALTQAGNHEVGTWLEQKNYRSLLSAWVTGQIIAWEGLYGSVPVKRISLSAYPFAKERYWVPEIIEQFSPHNQGDHSPGNVPIVSSGDQLHPLLHRNTSRFDLQRFSTVLRRDEFYLSDHQLKGACVLPGVAYLEMARAAVLQSSGMEADEAVVLLSNITWLRPAVVGDQPLVMHIDLTPQLNQQGGDSIGLSIYSGSLDRPNDEDKGGKHIYSQGIAQLLPVMEAPQVDVQSLQQSLAQSTLTVPEYYDCFKSIGLEYGSAFRGVEALYTDGSQVLARVRLPQSVAASGNDFYLHPSVMDAALQATALLIWQDESPSEGIPFALESAEIYGACRGLAWAWARYSPGSSADAKVQKFDIDLCDDTGRVAVRLQGFSARRLTSSPATQTLLVIPQWRDAEASQGGATEFAKHLVYAVESVSTTELAAVLPDAEYRQVGSAQAISATGYQRLAAELYDELQQLISSRLTKPVLLQVVVPPSAAGESLYGGIAGLLKTAQGENPKLTCQAITWTASHSGKSLPEVLLENRSQPDADEIRYVDGQRQVSRWHVLEVRQVPSHPWRDHGVYLLTGGVGGLGLIFAQDIVAHTQQATLILTGRSVLSEEQEVHLSKLRERGAQVVYERVDVTEPESVKGLMTTVVQRYGGLHGILHGAGVIRDSYIRNKNLSDVDVVLGPKVCGLEYLDTSSQAQELDFLVAFSSIAGALGNPGQGDYAAGNSFMDHYMIQRREWVKQGNRHGKSVSINWPLWRSGGMQLDKNTESHMMKSTGLSILESRAGIEAFYQVMAASDERNGPSQCLVLHGNPTKMREVLLKQTPEEQKVRQVVTRIKSEKQAEVAVSAIKVPSTETAIDVVILARQVESLLTIRIAEQLKLPKEEIEADIEWNELGYESVRLTEFAEGVSNDFGIELVPTLFFEYPTLSSFVGYLVEEHKSNLERYFGGARQTQKVDVQITETKSTAVAEEKISSTTLLRQLEVMLTSRISNQLKIPTEDIEGDMEWSELGYESVRLTEFAESLNDDLDIELVPTLFFEHLTLSALSEYLVEEYPSNLQRYFNSSSKAIYLLTEGNPSSVASALSIPTPSVAQQTPEFGATAAQSSVVKPISVSRRDNEPVAVIGISGCFPMAEDVDTFWDNLVDGRDCIREIPKARWDWREIYGDPTTEENKTHSKWGGFIDGIDKFDPLFFGISPREAELMDPQQRLLMMHAWKSIEDAGYSPSGLAESDTCVFFGTTISGYRDLVDQAGIAPEQHSATGVIASVGPNRVSYLLNLHGASQLIDTACSSSLVAVHRGVLELRSGRSQLAIVGGVNTIVTPTEHISFSKAGMLSKTGRCKTFSDKADGYVRGEGVGVFTLKLLSDAERDGDSIYGVILGTAENHGGKAASLTAPNVNAQKALLKNVYNQAKIDPRTVTYIEAHGTGTELGDPVEFNGLKSAFAELYAQHPEATVSDPRCALGSLKTNIGHLELAAGAAGLMKVLMQFKYKKLAKTLHCDQINPYINLKGSPFYILQDGQEWEALHDQTGNIIPRRAGISSFGFGGVNAHIVLEEYCKTPQHLDRIVADRPPVLITLSAKNSQRLLDSVKNLIRLLEEENTWGDADLANIAYTLQVGRASMEERFACIVTSLSELKEKLALCLTDNTTDVRTFRSNSKSGKDIFSSLSMDKHFGILIENWMLEKNYDQLASMWVKGLNIPWLNLYRNNAGQHSLQRVHLPTYPFAKESYWPGGYLDEEPAPEKIFEEQVVEGQQNFQATQEFPETSTPVKRKVIMEERDVSGIINSLLNDDISVDEAVRKTSVLPFKVYGEKSSV